MRSIKGYLFTNLIAGVLLTTVLATVSQMYIGYREVRPHLDAQLAMVAYTISTFITENTRQSSFYNKVRQNILTYEKAIKDIHYDDPNAITSLHASIDNIQFRVYDHRNQLIVSTPSAPHIALQTLPAIGFSKRTLSHQQWRVFNLMTQKGDHIIVMQPHSTRLDIEKNSNNNAILITLLSIGPLGLFILLIIGRSLGSIHQTSNEIKQRAPHNLNPICNKNVPTELQPLIRELNSLFKRLHDTFLRESRFASDAAHELKTPLAALRTYAQVAMAHNDPKQIKAELQKVNKAVQRATHTVDQLLLLSKTMPDAQSHTHKPIALTALLRQCIADIAPQALKKNISIALEDQSQHDGVTILGHEVTLSLLFANLIDNAIRYSPANTDIDVCIQDTPTQVHITIMDQGPGIPEELHQRIFERFFRVPGSKVQGTGLGLNIVQQIAEIHQANVRVHTPGNQIGTTFELTFPKYPHTTSK